MSNNDREQLNILIVDDTPKNIQALGNMLRQEGYSISFATSGRQALEMVLTDTFDLILLDVVMPEMDGFEVCRKLKEISNSKDIPVIFLTARIEREDIVKGFEAGGVDYVTKPIEIEEVLARVRTHLTLHNMHKEFEARNERLEEEITERRRVEKELRESETRYRLLISNLPAIVYRGYIDWSVDFMDDKITLLTGYHRDEFNSRHKKWSDVIVVQDIEMVKQAFTQALKTDQSYVREYRIRTRRGESLWIQDRGHIICDRDGRVEYISGVFFDVTERKRLEKAIVQREKLNTLGAIAAEVAHEIRNPLVSIGGFARRLQKKFPDMSECAIILHECQRLEKILSRIRNYLKPVEVYPQQCSVNSLITQCVDLLSPEMVLRKVTCQLDLHPKLSMVYTDPDILTQIFVNLILNAAQAMDNGGILTIKTFESNRDLHIEFRNPTSEPVLKEPELLFTSFAEGGQSIGLPLCYRLLRDMGGLLLFTSEKDAMVFTISLPKTLKPNLEKGVLSAC